MACVHICICICVVRGDYIKSLVYTRHFQFPVSKCLLSFIFIRWFWHLPSCTQNHRWIEIEQRNANKYIYTQACLLGWQTQWWNASTESCVHENWIYCFCRTSRCDAMRWVWIFKWLKNIIVIIVNIPDESMHSCHQFQPLDNWTRFAKLHAHLKSNNLMRWFASL